jgi:hypothetical protein
MSSELLIPSLRDLPPSRLAQRSDHLRSEIALRPRRPRACAQLLVFAALVIALATVLLATPAFGLRDHIVRFFASDRRPPELIVRYFENQNVAPPGSAPGVIASKARVALVPYIPGYGKEIIWVAPIRAGFCSTNACDRDRSTLFNATLSITGPTSRNSQPAPGSRDVHVLFEGDTIFHRAARVAIRFEDGSSETTPVVWAKKPIDADFFVYELPKEHWKLGKRPVLLAVEDASGNELASQTEVASSFVDSQRLGFAPASERSKAAAQASKSCSGVAGDDADVLGPGR